MASNINRRVRDLEQAVPDPDFDPYAPEHTIVIMHTSAAVHMVHSEAAAAGQPSQTAEQKERRDAVVQATVGAINGWCASQARRVGWREPYYLDISFPHTDQHPDYARFNVPWLGARRTGFDMHSALAVLTGKGRAVIHWLADGGPVDGDPYADDEIAYQSMGLPPLKPEREELLLVAAEPAPAPIPVEPVRTPVQPEPARTDNSAALQTLLRAYSRNQGGAFNGQDWPF